LGEKSLADLEIAMLNNPRYKDGRSSETARLVDAVKRMMSVSDKSELNHPGFSNLFSMLPDDIMLLLLVGYLNNTADLFKVATTSKYYHSLFQQNYPRRMLRHLLDHAALGEWDAARKIWSRNPEILALKGTVFHPGRYRYEKRTAFQIAWMNEEDDIVEEMKIILSSEEQQKQFNEIFPDGELKKYDYDFETAKLLVQDVYTAIIKDNVISENNLESHGRRHQNRLASAARLPESRKIQKMPDRAGI